MNKVMLIIIGAVISLFLGCSHDIPDPASPVAIDGDIPPTPLSLTATVGDRSAALSWSIGSDTAQYTYRIYVAPFDSSRIAYSLLGESGVTSYSVGNLQNGAVFFFKISAVNSLDFEGYKSDSIAAAPNHYGFMINNGGEYTGSRNVSLNMQAPPGTSLMIVSEDPSFAGVQWESFVPTRDFQLSAEDGMKAIYCRFRDIEDRLTTGFFEDRVYLDTRAVIDSVRFSPSGVIFSPGESIHFSLYPAEPGGSGSVVIGNDIINMALYDNGLGGDAVADDGVYEIDYTIASDLDFENQDVHGNFTDRAGINAPEAAAGDILSVRRAPNPVTVYSISVPDDYFNRLSLSWSLSNAADFAQYRVYRAASPGADSSDYLVSVITSRTTASTIDTDLDENTRYYYRVYVLDNTGLWSGSEEVSQITGQDLPPDPVDLYAPFATPGYYDRLELNWSSSGENDLLRYELYRSDDPIVDSLDTMIFSSPSETSYTDTGLSDDSLYHYAVVTRDLAGNISWSNTASGRTNVDLPPAPVTLFPVIVEPDYYENVTLDWGQAADNDFGSYRLYRWQEDIGRNDSVLAALITDSGTTVFDDSPAFNVAADTINFWYVLYLYDAGGNIAPSDSVRAHLIDSVPGTVTGSVDASSNSLIISWLTTDIPDFGNYLLLRDTDADPAGAITVYVSSDQQTGTFDDVSAVQGQVYFYWLDILDRRDNSSRSTLGSGSW